MLNVLREHRQQYQKTIHGQCENINKEIGTVKQNQPEILKLNNN